MEERKNSATAAVEQPEVLMTRIFDAPRELVFKAFSEAEALAQWWGPKGMAMTVAKLEFRPGGTFHYNMKTPDGATNWWGRLVYREIVPPSKIVFLNSFADEHANPARNPYLPAWPIELESTVTFEDQNGKTKVTMRGVPHNASESERQAFAAGRKGMEYGFSNSAWPQLEAYLAKAQAEAGK